MFVEVGAFSAKEEQTLFVKGDLKPKTHHCFYDIVLMIL